MKVDAMEEFYRQKEMHAQHKLTKRNACSTQIVCEQWIY